MSELGSGGGSSYPGTLDTDAILESASTLARFNVPNDMGAAIIAIETELGTDPAGSLTDLKTRLAVVLNNDGTFKDPINLDGAVVINDSGADKDFRVESDDLEYMLHMNAGTDQFGIGKTPGDTLDVRRTRTTDGSARTVLNIEIYDTDEFVDGQGCILNFSGGDAGAPNNRIGRISAIRTGADTTGSLILASGVAGLVEGLRIAPTEVVVNEGSVDLDFRVESNGITTALGVDAGSDYAYACNFYPTADDTYYLGKNDDDTPFAWKGLILKDTNDGKYYRIQLTNGAVDIIDLTD